MNNTQLQDSFTKSVNELTDHFTETLQDVAGYIKQGDFPQANLKLSQCESMWQGVSRTIRNQIKLLKQQENFARYQPQSTLPLGEVGGRRRTG